MLNILLIAIIVLVLVSIGIWFTPIWFVMKLIISLVFAVTAVLVFIARYKMQQIHSAVKNVTQLMPEEFLESFNKFYNPNKANLPLKKGGGTEKRL